MNDLVTLKKIEQSKLAIKEVKTLDEIKKVVNQSEALKAYAKSAQMSAEIQADIAELNIRAMRRLGEISAALEKSKGGQPHQKKSTLPNSGRVETKTATLANAGIDIRRANEAEKLAAIPEKVFETKIAEAKEASETITKSLFEEFQRKQQTSDSLKISQRIAKYRKTGIKSEGWRDGIDDELAREADERDERLDERFKKVEEKRRQEEKYQNDPFPAQFKKYLDNLDCDAHRIAVCHSVMRICRQIFATLR